jgi:Flp pilus assembly protein TadG
MRRTRPGSVLPTLGVCLIALFGFVALAVDLGMLAVSRTQCQNAADAAALVGARNLHNREGVADTNRADALAKARAAAKANPNLNKYLGDAEIASVVAGQYSYDAASQRFRVSYPAAIGASDSWSAVRVELASSQPTYFMRVMGVSTMPTGAAATAVHRPRDIAFVLDFTGSMAFASTSNWPDETDPVTNVKASIEGLMNPDPDYPKFGHYGRYVHYQTNSVSLSSPASAAISDRPNPLRTTATYKNSTGSFYANNHTIATSGGPPVVEDFYTAIGDPATVNTATPRKNAFKMWDPSGGSYDAMAGACPAPSNFDVQSDAPVPYVGDKWPRTDGKRGSPGGTWSTPSGATFTDLGAKTLKEYLGYTTPVSRDLTPYTLPSGGNGTSLLPAGNTRDGGDSDANMYDALWEKYGYDLDVESIRAGYKPVSLPASNRFLGYSMGPGYWGKTFFIWPPDPRPALDWRRRFFLRGDGAAFDPQIDNINAILFRTSLGHTLNTVVTTVSSGYTVNNQPGYYRLNYPAIIAWLKSGPQALPTNLRSGRILYYSSIPNDLTTGASGNADDRTFWREYVHFVLGVDSFDSVNAPLSTNAFRTGYSPHRFLAGVESRFPFGTPSANATAAYTPGGGTANPKPYMNYTDNVNRPRMHFWFGPQSMLQFLKLSGSGEDRPWWSGTTHESQCWQLKASVNSVLDDIKRNHPNDYCGIAGFANRGNYGTPLAPMGQDYFTLKNVLFFRRDHVADMKANAASTAEGRPYTPAFGDDIDLVPNSKGGTDANSGLALAFNMLSTSPTLLATGNYGVGGRKGASKIVVFETDGRPSARGRWFVTGSGADTRYELVASNPSPELWTSDASLVSYSRNAVKVVERIVAPVSATGTSGFSLPNAPARVYAIAFGDIFNGYDDGSIGQEGTDALRFLLRVQQVGNTSPGTVGTADPPSARIPAEQIITGSYDVRISKMKSALERIAQSGVQVTLVE